MLRAQGTGDGHLGEVARRTQTGGSTTHRYLQSLVTEALAIARTLGPQHVYSLAGVGRVPTDLTCEVRVGGYGGARCTPPSQARQSAAQLKEDVERSSFHPGGRRVARRTTTRGNAGFARGFRCFLGILRVCN